jgi:hypothetical protein
MSGPEVRKSRRLLSNFWGFEAVNATILILMRPTPVKVISFNETAIN